MTTRQQLPWSAFAVIVENDIPRVLPTGTVLTDREGQRLFGASWDAQLPNRPARRILACSGSREDCATSNHHIRPRRQQLARGSTW